MIPDGVSLRELAMTLIGFLAILGAVAVVGMIAYQIVIAIKYKGMRYNWFAFKHEGLSYGLEKPDILLLRDIAFENRVPDFMMMYSSARTLDTTVIRSVERVKNSELTDEEKHVAIERIFLLRNKMDGIIASRRQTVSHSNQIRANQPVELTFERIGSYQTYVLETTPKFFAAAMPMEALDVQDFTWEGKKVRVKFHVSNDAEYSFISKVLDQTMGSGITGHINIEHSNRITRTQKRIFRRNAVSIAVSMFSLRVTGEGASRKVSIANTIPFSGTIVNLSAGGVAVRAGGLLRENTLVKLDFSLDFENTEVAIGRVLACTGIPNSTERMLHIRFERISRKTRNNIFEYVYRDADEKKNFAPKTIIPTANGILLSPDGAQTSGE